MILGICPKLYIMTVCLKEGLEVSVRGVAGDQAPHLGAGQYTPYCTLREPREHQAVPDGEIFLKMLPH